MFVLYTQLYVAGLVRLQVVFPLPSYDNVVQIRAIPVLRPDLRLGYIMLISVQFASFTLGQTSLSLSEMGGCIWDVFLFDRLSF